jgi:hypothetical protein
MAASHEIINKYLMKRLYSIPDLQEINAVCSNSSLEMPELSNWHID